MAKFLDNGWMEGGPHSVVDNDNKNASQIAQPSMTCQTIPNHPPINAKLMLQLANNTSDS